MTKDRSCRLLYIVGQLGAGGLERQLCYFLKAMERKRYRPAVVVWNFSETDVYLARMRELDVPVYCFPNRSSPAVKLQEVRRLVRQLEPEVVHSYSFYTNFAAFWGALGRPAIAMGSVRGDLRQDKKCCGVWLGSLSACWPSDQICNSFSAAEMARRLRKPFVPRRLYVVRNGLDLEQFRVLPPSGKACIVGIGSLLPIKRWDRVLEAAKSLKRRHFDFMVRIAGDGPLLEPLKQQAQVLAVDDCVEFVGHKSDVPGFLGNSMFLVHTSDTEGCPNVVMEAMACGRAVVATDAGDVSRLVEDGETGFVVRRGDAATLVARMGTLLSDPDLCRRMGEAARAKAEREFRLDRLVAETFMAYRAAGWRG